MRCTREGRRRLRELAARAGGLAERYVREWALAQAANGYLDYDAAGERFSLSPEQAMVFGVKDSPVYLEGAFDLAAAMIEGEPKVEQGFRDGGGVALGRFLPAACSAPSARSSGRAMSTTSCNRGCRRWTACGTSWKRARRSPMSAAAWDFRRC